jgi:hypothetical protein
VRIRILSVVSLAVMLVLAVSTTAGAVATKQSSPSAGQAPVNLRTAASFAILTKSGITDVPSSTITGDVGASPITGAAIGLRCSEVTGTIYSVNAAGPLPCRVTAASRLTTAVSVRTRRSARSADHVEEDPLVDFDVNNGRDAGSVIRLGRFRKRLPVMSRPVAARCSWDRPSARLPTSPARPSSGRQGSNQSQRSQPRCLPQTVPPTNQSELSRPAHRLQSLPPQARRWSG